MNKTYDGSHHSRCKIFCECLIAMMLCFFVACEEELNNIQSNFIDTARLTWSVDTLNDFSSLFWVHDTNNIFILSGYYPGDFRMYWFNGKEFIRYDIEPYYQLGGISGLSPQEVYLSGFDVRYTPVRLVLMKWNPGGFQYIPVSIELEPTHAGGAIYAHSSKEIFLGSNNGFIYRYDGTSFNRYEFDTALDCTGFFTSQNNEVYVFMSTFILNSKGDTALYKFYQFSNNNFVQVYSQLFINEIPYRLNQVGDDIVGLKNNALFIFNNSNFIPWITMNGFELSGEFTGSSLNNLLSTGNYGSYPHFFYWDGRSWSDERQIPGFLQQLGNTSGSFISLLSDSYERRTYLYKSKLKVVK